MLSFLDTSELLGEIGNTIRPFTDELLATVTAFLAGLPERSRPPFVFAFQKPLGGEDVALVVDDVFDLHEVFSFLLNKCSKEVSGAAVTVRYDQK